MYSRAAVPLLSLLFVLHGCLGASRPVRLKYTAKGNSPVLLAVYEAWFGEPNHISVGYSSHNPQIITRQIEAARKEGITAFVVDWYGDRDPFVNRSYAIMQRIAARKHFHIAMMYDQASRQVGATDQVIADLTQFRTAYLSSDSPGHRAYLTYHGHPVIFVFPHGHFTNWGEVRNAVDQWNPSPLLIDENLPGQYASDFDGFYAWINPGPKGWAANGSNWGNQYLADFYRTMANKYSDKIIVGGAWARFDDSKASWSLNRHIAARCGKTFRDTLTYWKLFFPAKQVIPFIMIETWNDYEEGSAIERGIPACGDQHPISSIRREAKRAPPSQYKSQRSIPHFW